jgi:hypothetical protein
MPSFRELLVSAGLSRAAFARLAGVHPNTVTRWRDEEPQWARALVAQYAELQELRRKDSVNRSLCVDPLGKGVGYVSAGTGG